MFHQAAEFIVCLVINCTFQIPLGKPNHRFLHLIHNTGNLSGCDNCKEKASHQYDKECENAQPPEDCNFLQGCFFTFTPRQGCGCIDSLSDGRKTAENWRAFIQYDLLCLFLIAFFNLRNRPVGNINPLVKRSLILCRQPVPLSVSAFELGYLLPGSRQACVNLRFQVFLRGPVFRQHHLPQVPCRNVHMNPAVLYGSIRGNYIVQQFIGVAFDFPHSEHGNSCKDASQHNNS